MTMPNRNRKAARAAALACAFAALAGLAGCGADHTELQAWMDDTRRAAPQIKEDVPAPKKFEPYRYANATALEPFAPSRLVKPGDAVRPRVGGGLQPDMNRRREPLEAYPVDTIRMIGHLRDGKRNLALLTADNLVYQAQVGHYIGQNFGLITKVSETEIRVRELVQDAAGDWTERETTLQLQESKK